MLVRWSTNINIREWYRFNEKLLSREICYVPNVVNWTWLWSLQEQMGKSKFTKLTNFKHNCHTYFKVLVGFFLDNLKRLFTQNWNFAHSLLTALSMVEAAVTFSNAHNRFGALEFHLMEVCCVQGPNQQKKNVSFFFFMLLISCKCLQENAAIQFDLKRQC